MNNYEVIIIGGSYSGLSAAMALGRAIRNVLVIDSGKPCNRQTPHSHNFITQDGETPATITRNAKEQVLAYPTVTFIQDKAIDAAKNAEGFTITTEKGRTCTAKKLLFATGVTDVMPDIGGFADCWGISIIHCPYCHGYEVKGQDTAILANGDAAMHYAGLLQQWTGSLTIFTNGTPQFTAEQAEKLKRNNIPIIETPIATFEHDGGQLKSIVMKDGTSHSFGVLYARPAMKQHCILPEQLGCQLNEMGFIQVDEMKHTTVSGVYASGDCTTPMRAVAAAVASGTMAGAAINHSLCEEMFL